MENLDTRIKRFGALCKKGASKGLTKSESQEFRKLEKSISNTMLKDESLYDRHIGLFRKASKPLIEEGR